MARNHILDISQRPARLKVSLNRLVVVSEDASERRLPFEDVAVVVVSHPQVSYSQAVLSSLMDNGAAFVTCGSNRLPNGMLLPLAANGTQTERFAAQSNASRPNCKRLWQQVIRSKIGAQAAALAYLFGEDFGLSELKRRVRSGDPSNVEAQAAKRYWSKLFGHNHFRRDFDALDENQWLNYGYAVIRAIVGRAICAAGLHPTIGLHHHNRYNAFCLADDLMEPLRPIVDVAVYALLEEPYSRNDLTPPGKRALISALNGKQFLAGESRSLFDIATAMSVSLAQVFMGQRGALELPELVFAEKP